MNKKNILFIIPEVKSGGAEKTISNLVKYFQTYYPEFNVYVCAMRKTIDIGNIIFLKYDARLSKNIIQKLLFKYNQIKEVRKLKKKLRIDVAVSFIDGADFVNVASRYKEKIVISIRNNLSLLYDKKNFVKRCCIDFALRNTDYIVTLSKSIEKSVKEKFCFVQDKISTIYNPIPPIDEKLFKEPLLIKKLHEEGKLIIVTAGRLTQQKGQWHLIRAVKEIIKVENKIELIILGKGDLEDELKELTHANNIENKVHFLGFVDNAFEYIKYSDVFVFPSLFEGLGNVLIEALMLGIPIISSDCSFGPRELLAPNGEGDIIDGVEFAEYGVLVHGDDEELFSRDETEFDYRLSKAIFRLVNNKNIMDQYRRKSRKRVEEFAPAVITKEWNDVFLKLIDKPWVTK